MVLACYWKRKEAGGIGRKVLLVGDPEDSGGKEGTGAVPGEHAELWMVFSVDQVVGTVHQFPFDGSILPRSLRQHPPPISPADPPLVSPADPPGFGEHQQPSPPSGVVHV